MPNLPPPNLTFHEKLEGPNYLSWLTQILPIMRAKNPWALLMEPNHALQIFWLTTVISKFLNQNLQYGEEKIKLFSVGATLPCPRRSCPLFMDLILHGKSALANQFANKSKSRIANLKKQLQSLHQGSKNCSDYIQIA
jgi:hypothetical protein